MQDPQQAPDSAAPSASKRRPKPAQYGLLRAALLLACVGGTAVVGLSGMNFLSSRVEAYVPQRPAAATSSPQPSLLTARLNTQTPEGQLISAYQLLAKGEESQAFETVEALVKRQPDFSLAQLVYADLLLARSTPEAAAQALAGASEEQRERSQALRQEARLRLAALVERPPQDALPKELIGLPATVQHAIVVDTQKARLYLFQNRGQGMELVKDSYVSLGKAGVSKQMEGDQRTPLGVYQVGLRRDEAAARYGAAALPLNYPNEYDRMVGRGGSSIWLHGERAGSYARGPQSTDGCIVLSNDDMQFLADTVKARETPVLIFEHVDWVAKKDGKTPVDAQFESAFRQWQQARLQQDANALRGLYEPGLQRGSDSEAQRLAHNLARMQAHELPVQSLERLSVLPSQDLEPVMIVTYRELSALNPTPALKRQYWRQQEGRWRIIFDGVVS
ncbi:L,D-peptidoglycan transpeptidase YkuD (ErfK/YbiS/YcfS/YnhG family) [Paucibacter oligotrophus]|uniref:L,D-peptidoglycan transpeptidase YkuD (ErfK/YbiS/YcfS/YnhG family) n=1 Tax=Roseateles oligotrophus TaxID=1769250 RepID=A0A840L5K2_9BURK|nr:L,D-transpeptidase [Roseateles oligotrophus]MBB4841962.1 L,D-peptidoglycan transpeptidase YkuD (ErfK/YbiS/YcfS/YnhG family) [Roseateles oligotrophus]